MDYFIRHPALYPHLTAYDNSEAMHIARGIPNRESVVLEPLLSRIPLHHILTDILLSFSFRLYDGG